jgi:hypothetical protein
MYGYFFSTFAFHFRRGIRFNKFLKRGRKVMLLHLSESSACLFPAETDGHAQLITENCRAQQLDKTLPD